MNTEKNEVVNVEVKKMAMDMNVIEEKVTEETLEMMRQAFEEDDLLGVGDFDDAVTRVLGDPSLILVHTYFHNIDGRDFCLPWLERSGSPHEYLSAPMHNDCISQSNGPDLEPYDVRRYTLEDMMKEIITKRTLGPWEHDLCDPHHQFTHFAVDYGIAIHEAAHAACILSDVECRSWHLRSKVNFIAMHPTGERTGITNHSSPYCFTHRPTVHLAGVVAEALLCQAVEAQQFCDAFLAGDDSLLPYPEHEDVERAMELVEDQNVSVSEKVSFRRQFYDHTVLVVQKTAPAIVAIAKALKRKPFLTGRQIRRIYTRVMQSHDPCLEKSGMVCPVPSGWTYP